MTTLKTPIRRETSGTIFDRGQRRRVIVSLEPPNVIAVRLKGTRTEHRITSEAVYMMALKAHLAAQARKKK